jgi:hypothetical protein
VLYVAKVIPTISADFLPRFGGKTPSNGGNTRASRQKKM